MTARERPDVALVGLGESSEHALEMIDKIVREAACPVIVLLHAPDPGFNKQASERGVFAHFSDTDVDDWQSSIDTCCAASPNTTTSKAPSGAAR